MGERYGLKKYDGYTMKSYHYDPQNLNSLSDNWVTSLLEDSSGIIWIGTKSGLNRLDPVSDTIVRFRPDPGNTNSLRGYRVNSICEDRAGIFWIGTQGGGLKKFDPLNGSVHI